MMDADVVLFPTGALGGLFSFTANAFWHGLKIETTKGGINEGTYCGKEWPVLSGYFYKRPGHRQMEKEMAFRV